MNALKIININYCRIFLILAVFIGAFMVGAPYVEKARANSWFTVDGHVIDPYLNGGYYYDPPKAPISMQILLHGGGTFDGATDLQWDCDNDGTYEGSGSGTKSRTLNPGDGAIMIEWSNGWGFSAHSWNIYGSGQNEYWYELMISCSYQTGGQKRVNIKGERSGIITESSTSFNIQDLTFNFNNIDFPADGSYHPPIDDPRGVKEPGTKVPTNVDLGIGMKEDGRNYQNDSDYRVFDGRGFTYIVDCNGDGKFDDGGGSSNNSSFYIYPGFPPQWKNATFARNVCYFDKPGIRQINLKIKDPVGREHLVSKDIYLSPSDSFGIQVTPNSVEQTVPFNVNYSVAIKGLTPFSYGGYNIMLYCDESDSQPKAISGGNRSEYVSDGTLAKNIGTCSYEKPGDYKAKIRFEEIGPDSFKLSGVAFVDVLAGGGIQACNFDGKPREATVLKGTKLELRWNSINTDACVPMEGTPNVLGLNPPWVGNKKNEGISGNYSVPTGSMSGLYIFKLSCFRGTAAAPIASTPVGECKLRVK